MMNLTDKNDIRALLQRHGFRFSKSLGQNFLCAGWVPERTAQAAEADRDTGVLEIGPGAGCLTRELSLRAGKVLCVERDESLRGVLSETLAGCENVTVVFGDALKTDLLSLVREQLAGFEKLAVCANLPYAITTPILTKLTDSGCFGRITVMVQREVAQRICARDNTAEYGAFTVLMQWRCRAEMLFDVPPQCFVPAPKVISTVIRLDRRETPPCPVRDEDLMFRIVRVAFNQRRKTLINALAGGLDGRLNKADIAAAVTALGLDERVRGAALSIAQFAALADALGTK